MGENLSFTDLLNVYNYNNKKALNSLRKHSANNYKDYSYST